MSDGMLLWQLLNKDKQTWNEGFQINLPIGDRWGTSIKHELMTMIGPHPSFIPTNLPIQIAK